MAGADAHGKPGIRIESRVALGLFAAVELVALSIGERAAVTAVDTQTDRGKIRISLLFAHAAARLVPGEGQQGEPTRDEEEATDGRDGTQPAPGCEHEQVDGTGKEDDPDQEEGSG